MVYNLESIIVQALDRMGFVPCNLVTILKLEIEQLEIDRGPTLDEVFSHLAKAANNDPILDLFRHRLAVFDMELSVRGWTKGTMPNSHERRILIYTLMKLEEDQKRILDEKSPFFPEINPTVIIAGEHVDWYSDERISKHQFYWAHYRRYLKEKKKFPEVAIQHLDNDSSNIMQRLADPVSKFPVPIRGLVVGYVQSGKTTNFTALAAKAIDSGYRLVIVIAGTLDVLRNQTQRRFDMELVGKENILRYVGANEPSDYIGDTDWDLKFIEYGNDPSRSGGSDIIRLTSAKNDFKKLDKGISTLDLEKVDGGLPLYNENNLFSCKTRVVIVKKNSKRLESLIKDLSSVKKHLAEVPALIIDDESDQASVNTINPQKEKAKDKKERTAINGLLVKLLAMIPRAQYIGYTATPVANVFINPDDPQDLFPRDFVLSLREPDEYFGAKRFHDLDGQRQEDGYAKSNEKAFVRDIMNAIGSDDDELTMAIDLFILTGAVKLYRKEKGISGDYTHHTMLIHLSHLQDDHEALAERLLKLWDQAGYSSGRSNSRLADIYFTDILPVSEARQPNLPLPRDYASLAKFVDVAKGKILANDPVKVVNGTNEGDAPDFDQGEIWKIIVGGTKLSRGYTIEGLTISYFRRTAGAKDTMMQMGRWFGYRPGYSDLVRLFIGRNELVGKKPKQGSKMKEKRIDLLEAFKKVCLEERAFRDQLVLYSNSEDKLDRITPKDIPPLVEIYFPELPPVARNKMWNAELFHENYGFQWIQPTLFTENEKEKKFNLDLLLAMVAVNTGIPEIIEEDSKKYIVFSVEHKGFMALLHDFKWAGKGRIFFNSRENFLDGKKGNPEISDWLVAIPLLVGERTSFSVQGLPDKIPIIKRRRIGASPDISLILKRCCACPALS